MKYTSNKNNRVIYVANAGDSRTILSCGGINVNLSIDHKPDNDKEQ